MRNINTRKAIAMIELIFSIVVMGIVLLSVPMMMRVATESGYTALQQEGINEAASQIYIITSSYAWDENNTAAGSEINPILRVTNGDSKLEEFGNAGRRAGTPSYSGKPRSFFRSDGTSLNASSIGIDGNDNGIEDDMDDFDGSNTLIEIEAANTDYIEKGTNIDIAIDINYISDSITGGDYHDPGLDAKIVFTPSGSVTPTTNVKRIDVTLTSKSGVDELDKTIMLYGFSCNIGEHELDERWF